MSGSTADERRQCPTRASGPQPLIVHSIGVETCCERQRRVYHKCFACAWRGLGAGASLPPELAAAVARPAPEEPAVKPAAKSTAKKPAKAAPAPAARPKVSKAV